MPSSRVYFVDFAGGNRSPVIDVFTWGAMIQVGSTFGTLTDSGQGDPEGFVLSAFRPSAATTNDPDVSNSVYVIPTANKLPVESRLLMSLSFDRPSSEMISGDAKSPEPWAVGAKIKKFANSVDTSKPDEPTIAVTCQFRSTGVRLNTPLALQTDNSRTATDLDSPLDYGRYEAPQVMDPDAPPSGPSSPTRFVLQFLFCGVQAVPNPSSTRHPLGYAVGWGLLSIGTKTDQRVLSHDSLWSNTEPPIDLSAVHTIGAFGASVVTQGHGTVRARLRTFAVDLWLTAGTPPEFAPGPPPVM